MFFAIGGVSSSTQLWPHWMELEYTNGTIWINWELPKCPLFPPFYAVNGRFTSDIRPLEWPKLSVLNDNRNTFTEIEKSQSCCVTFWGGDWKLNIIFVAEVLLSSKELSGSRIWNDWSSYKFYSILLFHQITFALHLYKLILTLLITLVSYVFGLLALYKWDESRLIFTTKSPQFYILPKIRQSWKFAGLGSKWGLL